MMSRSFLSLNSDGMSGFLLSRRLSNRNNDKKNKSTFSFLFTISKTIKHLVERYKVFYTILYFIFTSTMGLLLYNQMTNNPNRFLDIFKIGNGESNSQFGNEQNYKFGLGAYSRGLTIFPKMFNSTGSVYEKNIYSQVINNNIDLYNSTNNPEYFENAFLLSQRSNYFVLRNATKDRKALELSGIQQDSIEEYLNLLSKVESYANDNFKNETQVFREFDAYRAALFINYPSFANYEEEKEVTITEVMSVIPENSMVVKYFYFNEKLTVFAITKNSIFTESINCDEGLDSIINLNLEILSQNATSDSLANIYLINSKKIYDLILDDLLIKHSSEAIQHLIIIPDGPLKKVPFSALTINSSRDWNDPRTYLINEYTISYLFHSSQLSINRNSFKSKGKFVGFGIEYKDDFLQEISNEYYSKLNEDLNNTRANILKSLKYADNEVLNTSEILNGTSYINRAVTPFQVIASIKNYNIVHLATHAFVDNNENLNSYFVLNKDNNQNYQLKYSDILKLDLKSELVVLNICQTSWGKNVGGNNNLMSLSKVFAQSGSDATVDALWNTPDYASTLIISLFYVNLKKGMSKSKALQLAQMQYLKVIPPKSRAPFFWASWGIYGNDQPINNGNSIFYE